MSKIIPLACALLLFSLPALAQGVDQIIHGSEGDPMNDAQIGERPDPNQDDLYNSGGKGSPPDHPGGGGGDDPVGEDDGPIGGDDGMPPEDNAPVPEPATGLLLGAGMLVLARIIHRRSRADAAEADDQGSGAPPA